jgi:hypothetical protein
VAPLSVAIGDALEAVGRADGYFSNQAIKTLMPEKMRTVAEMARTLGEFCYHPMQWILSRLFM